ncbi:MAG: GH39 family glycosyl hydrolase [bacterium]
MAKSKDDGVVKLRVDCGIELGRLDHIWRSIGYDEINWTYTPRGKRIYTEIKKLSDGPYYVRNHNAFTSGNGLSGPAAGSGNVYREDGRGNPIYDWTILDQVYDTFTANNCKALTELGFMPDDLAIDPPEGFTRHMTIPNDRCAFPPKDYRKWSDLVREAIKHVSERYGEDEVASWYWELWNEPDIPHHYWQGTLEEYCKLYDYSVAGVMRANPRTHIGGPGVAGSPQFLDDFLKHCAEGENAVTGERGARLDFISFHTKGASWPKSRDEVVKPSLKRMIDHLYSYRERIVKYPQFSSLPCFFDECDPSVGTILGVYDNPSYEFRNNEYYPAFLCRLAKNLLDFKMHFKFNLELFTSWAFYFEGKRFFEGNRTLFTNENIRKPVFNAFVMLSHLGDTRISLIGPYSKEPIPYPAYEFPVDGLASRKGNKSVQVLVWNFDDDPKAVGDRKIEVTIENLPFDAVRYKQYRIDRDHSNSYTEWVRQGRPQDPTPEQLMAIKHREGLELAEFLEYWDLEDHTFKRTFVLPMHGVALIELTPARV